MKRDSSSPEAYREDVEGKQRALLEEIRSAIFEVAPKISEGIEHGMLDYPGLANLAAQKDYVSLYVAPSVLAKRKADFPGVNAGKSCLRFRRTDQIDRPKLKRLLKEVLAYRKKNPPKH